jgi:Txe/YoeB family toxin of Txe-Axe toxin-antitoxin module
MANPLIIAIKESEEELAQYIRIAKTPTKRKRLRILVEIKKAGSKGISKRGLSTKTKLNHNTVQIWRKIYGAEGIAAFLEDGRTGFKPSGITVEEHEAIGSRLNDPYNGLQGYMELKHWYEATYNKEIKYNTLLKYCVRHFKSSCKVARKSHMKKDVNEVDHFKKTSVQSATTFSQGRKTVSKK